MHRALRLASRSLRPLSSSLAAALLALAAASCTDDSVELSLRLPEGSRWKLSMEQSAHITHTVGDDDVAVDQTLTLDLSLHVSDVADDGTTTIAARFDRVRHAVNHGRGEKSFDSSSPGDAAYPESRIFAGMVDRELTLRVGSSGEVLAVTGTEALREAMLAKMREGPRLDDAPIDSSIRVQVEQQFDERAFTDMFGQWFELLPSGPVPRGGAWSKTIHRARAFPTTQENEYRWTGTADGRATVELRGEVRPNERKDAIQAGAARLEYELRGEQTGTYEVDLATGRIITSERALVADGSQKTVGLPDGDQILPLGVRLTTRIRTEPAEPAASSAASTDGASETAPVK